MLEKLKLFSWNLWPITDDLLPLRLPQASTMLGNLNSFCDMAPLKTPRWWIILWNWTDIHGKFSAAFVVFSSMLHLDLQIVCSTDLVWTIDVSVFECRHQSCFFCISWAIEIEKTINWPSRSWLSYRTLQDKNGLLPLSESYQKNPHADFATSAVVTISWYLALSAIRAVSQGRGKKGLPGWFGALFLPCCPGV